MRLFHFIAEEHVPDVVAAQRLKVSLLDDLNDPFELNAVELPDRQFRKKIREFKSAMARDYGILCFSKNWKSPLLWSHYANRHKGVALEFDVLDSVAHPIVYRINRYSLNYEKLTTGLDREDIEGLWLTKYIEWEYEKEVRVILRKSECRKEGDIYFYDLGKDIRLKGIVLGPLCDIPVQDIEDSLPKASKLAIIKARLAFRSFNIVRKKDFATVHLWKA